MQISADTNCPAFILQFLCFACYDSTLFSHRFFRFTHHSSHILSPFIHFPFVFIPLVTPFERSPVLVFEFSMAKLFIWPCHLSVQCVLLGQPYEALVMIPGVKGQSGCAFKLYLSRNPEFCLHMCVYEPCPFSRSGYQSAAGYDEWLPGAEVHVVITSGKGFCPCWQGNRKG